MSEAVAFSAVRSTACMRALRVTMSLKRERAGAAALHALEFGFERAGGERIAQRDLQPLGADRLHDEIHRARAHRGDDRVDAAMRGLHDHRNAQPHVAHAREHAIAVEIGHHEIEDHGVDAAAVGSAEHRDRRIAAVGRHHVEAEAARHRFEQAALHGIVVDDEDKLGHGDSTATVPNWRTMAEAA